MRRMKINLILNITHITRMQTIELYDNEYSVIYDNRNKYKIIWYTRTHHNVHYNDIDTLFISLSYYLIYRKGRRNIALSVLCILEIKQLRYTLREKWHKYFFLYLTFYILAALLYYSGVCYYRFLQQITLRVVSLFSPNETNKCKKSELELIKI